MIVSWVKDEYRLEMVNEVVLDVDGNAIGTRQSGPRLMKREVYAEVETGKLKYGDWHEAVYDKAAKKLKELKRQCEPAEEQEWEEWEIHHKTVGTNNGKIVRMRRVK